MLKETMQGTAITLANRSQTSAASDFDHRFKVTPRSDTLHVRKGFLYTGKNKPTDGSGDSGSSGTGSATPEQDYTLAYGEPTGVLFIIADFTPSESSSNPSPKVTQRVLGDLYAFTGGAGNGLTVGPPELLTEGEETMLAWYAGTLAWNVTQQRYAFTRAKTPEGEDAEPLFTLPLVTHRKDHAPGIPYTEQ